MSATTPLRYLSVCSGIEAASVAWHPLGWAPVAFAEIDRFPSRVLAARFPSVPNFGDLNAFRNWTIGPIDLLVGGTPCQAFSTAGKREGLADSRGNLTLTYCQIADYLDPEWIVWENVPGVLSSKDNAFGCFLGELCGSGGPLSPIGGGGDKWANAGLVSGPKRTIAWRVLDAQFFGVAQRRRRVFVVAVRGSRNWRCAKALFPVGEGLFWDSPPGRETGEGATSTIAGGPGRGGWPAGIASTLDGSFGKKYGFDNQHVKTGCPLFVPAPMVMAHGQANAEITRDCSPSLTCLHEAPIAFSSKDHGGDCSVDLSPTLRAMTHKSSNPNGGGQVSIVAPTITTCKGSRAGSSSEALDEILAVHLAREEKPDSRAVGKVAPWTLCDCCEDYWCNIHGAHAYDCDCPPIDEWNTDPYGLQAEGPAWEFQAMGFTAAEARRTGTIKGSEIAPTLTSSANRGDTQPCVAYQRVVGTDLYNGNLTGDVAATMGTPGSSVNATGPTVMQAADVVAPTLTAANDPGRSPQSSEVTNQVYSVLQASPMQVRRLTPTECERLQGFPDGWTQIGVEGKPTPDSHRYKAIGNSMAVPVMRWIGERIDLVVRNRI